MFVRVLDESVIQYDRKYKIVGIREHQANYVGKFYVDSTWIFRFHECHTKKTLAVEMDQHYYYKVYEFVSQKPQWNMERRAVTMIVRRLIGDECFEW